MIREQKISRDRALAEVMQENQPRWHAISEYARTVGVDYNDLLLSVEKMPKLYVR